MSNLLLGCVHFFYCILNRTHFTHGCESFLFESFFNRVIIFNLINTFLITKSTIKRLRKVIFLETIFQMLARLILAVFVC